MGEATPDDIMTLVYTSGTTGPPKGAMLANANFAYCADTVINVDGRLPGNMKPNPDDQILTYLPLCHVAERIFSTWTMAAFGTVLNFAESIETVQRTCGRSSRRSSSRYPASGRRSTPGAHQGQGRHLVQADLVRSRLQDGPVRRPSSGSPTAARTRSPVRIVYAIGYPWCSGRCGSASVCAAAAGPERVPPPSPPRSSSSSTASVSIVYELYGMTENSAVATVNPSGDMKLGTVGEPYPEIDLRSTRRPARSRPSTTACSRATGTSRRRPPRRSPRTGGCAPATSECGSTGPTSRSSTG
jgi:long-chain acyl-CoA synthetase